MTRFRTQCSVRPRYMCLLNPKAGENHPTEGTMETKYAR